MLEQFGPERMQYILANTVLKKEHDGRISRDNKAWAKTIPMPEDGGDPRHSYVLVVDKVNPGLTDLFLKQARKVLQALLTGQLAPSAEGGTAFFAAPSSAFSFCRYLLSCYNHV